MGEKGPRKGPALNTSKTLKSGSKLIEGEGGVGDGIIGGASLVY